GDASLESNRGDDVQQPVCDVDETEDDRQPDDSPVVSSGEGSQVDQDDADGQKSEEPGPERERRREWDSDSLPNPECGRVVPGEKIRRCLVDDVEAERNRHREPRGAERAHAGKVNFWSVPEGKDESFADFLARSPGGRSAGDARAEALMFVEGFHAADPRLISARALADGGSPSEDPEEQRQMRIPAGYHTVVEWLARGSKDE